MGKSIMKLQEFIKMVLDSAPEAQEITFDVSVCMVGNKFVYVEIYQPNENAAHLKFTVKRKS